jgi:hypothetical protein
MITEIFKVELRKVGAYYIVCLVLITACVLFYSPSLASNNLFAAVFAIAQGGVLAWGIFSDTEGTGTFIFSKPISRYKLFIIRWAVGIALQVLTLVVAVVVIASGLRSGIQIVMGSLYHPMIRWYELEILFPLGVFSLLSYESLMFLRLRGRVLAENRARMWIAIFFLWLVIPLSLLLLLLIHPQPIFSRASLGLFGYLAVLTVLATAASAQCYRTLEVEASYSVKRLIAQIRQFIKRFRKPESQPIAVSEGGSGQ